MRQTAVIWRYAAVVGVVLTGGCVMVSGGGETVAGKRNVRTITIERELPYPAELVWERVFLDYGGASKFNPKVVSSGYLGEVRAAAVGAERYMYYDDAGDQGVHERLEMIDSETRQMRFRVVEARELPIDTEATFGESELVPLDENRSMFRLSFHFRTRPRFLALFAERQIRRDLQNMTVGIEYFLTTGEPATPEIVAELTSDAAR